MNITDLRTMFKTVSDRKTWTDSMIDFYINAGQKWLALKTRLKQDFVQQSITIKAGDITVDIPRAQVINEVKRKNSSNKWVPVNWLPFEDAQRLFPLWDGTDTGTPSIWTIPEVLHTGLDEDTQTIAILPPSINDENYKVSTVLAPADLSDSNTTSSWSVSYPDVLILAACYKYEILNGNNERAVVYEKAVDDQLDELDKVTVMNSMDKSNQPTRNRIYEDENATSIYTSDATSSS